MIGAFIYFTISLGRIWNSDAWGELDYLSPLLFLSMLSIPGMVILLGLFWVWVLRILTGRRTPFVRVIRIHILSWYGRYLPGKFGQMFGKVILGKSLGISTVPLVLSVIYEHIFFLSSGLVISMLLVGHWWREGLIQPLVAVLFFALIVVLSPWIIRGGYFLTSRFTVALARHKKNMALSLRDSALVLLAYHLAHIVAGIGFFMLLTSLKPGHGVSLIQAIGILTIAHVGGILAFFAPAGLGVREAILASLLAPHVGENAALSIALITRIWSTLGDVLLGMILFIPKRE